MSDQPEYSVDSLAAVLDDVYPLPVCELDLFLDAFRLHKQRKEQGGEIPSPRELGIALGAYRQLKMYLDLENPHLGRCDDPEEWLRIIKTAVDWLDETYAFGSLEESEIGD